MTKINLQHMFSERMNELADKKDEEVFQYWKKKCIQYSDPTTPLFNPVNVFKAGYTAALNDVETKVSGLVEALYFLDSSIKQAYIRNWSNETLTVLVYDCNDKVTKALAEFTAQADKDER